ncbi:MAG TPA: protease inhibitor I42 family protein [Terriglobales bacterium]|nr:protease inhibitor I42 family protein [Terriglobales bacterium]
MQYDQHFDGKIISPRIGEEFRIALPETRTAGYRWTTVQNAAPRCELLQEQSAPNTGTAGGSGIHIWRFKAVSSGTGKIELHYGRSWKSAGPEQTFTVEVQIRP